jgi:hypothetical protein
MLIFRYEILQKLHFHRPFREYHGAYSYDLLLRKFSIPYQGEHPVPLCALVIISQNISDNNILKFTFSLRKYYEFRKINNTGFIV